MPSTDDLRLLSESVADYCSRALEIRRLRRLREAQQSFDPDVWSEMAALGWTAIAVDETRGGLGLGAAGVGVVCRALGKVLAPEPLLETAVTAAALLSALDQNDVRLHALMAGERVYTCPLRPAAWLGHTSLRARAEDDAFIIAGRIEQVSLADEATRLLLPVQLGGRVALFDIAIDMAGLELHRCVLADGSRSAAVEFSGARCPADTFVAFIDDQNTAIERALALTGIAASVYLLGLAEALLQITLDYVRTRAQFGRPIGSFQALQHRLVDLYLQQRLAGAAAEVAVRAHMNFGEVATTAARARQRACDVAMATVREAIQMHGAIGYTAQSDVALVAWRALVMVARFGGGRDETKAMASFRRLVCEGDAGLSAAAAPPDRDLQPSGNDWNGLQDDHFRAVARAWLDANYPAHLRHLAYQVRWNDIRDWHQRLLERGWAAPAWPREHGGMGLEATKLLVFIEELERLGVARAPDQGIVMLGPILFAYGTDEQRERYLGPALRGEQIWCQGYSEPNAGSDLAALTTRAVRDGDEFVVNGQKTWTTHALDATHMYCLVRTDVEVKPQAGISFLLIDLKQPGVTIRPIANLGGHVDFCEVFLDDVRVPVANLVGEINEGWTIAKALLGHERLFVGSPKLCQHALNQLRLLAAHTGMTKDPVFVDALVTATLDVLDLEALYAEFAEIAKDGKTFGADVALLKI